MINFKKNVLGLVKYIGKFISFLLGLGFFAILILAGIMLVLPKIINKEGSELFLQTIFKNQEYLYLLDLTYSNINVVIYLIIWGIISFILVALFSWKLRRAFYLHGIYLFIIGFIFLLINNFYALIANMLNIEQLIFLEEKWNEIVIIVHEIGKYYLISGTILLFISLAMFLNQAKKKAEKAKEEISIIKIEEPIIEEKKEEIIQQTNPDEVIDIPIDLPPVEVKEYCDQCGTLLEKDQIYCSECGNKINK